MKKSIVLQRHVTDVQKADDEPVEQVVSYFVIETTNTLDFAIGDELTSKLVEDIMHSSELRDHAAYEVTIR